MQGKAHLCAFLHVTCDALCYGFSALEIFVQIGGIYIPCGHLFLPAALQALQKWPQVCQQVWYLRLAALAATDPHPASDTAHHRKCWETQHHPWGVPQGVDQPACPHGLHVQTHMGHELTQHELRD